MDVDEDEVSSHFETARTAGFSDAVLAIAISRSHCSCSI
jgi:hypothetical protein